MDRGKSCIKDYDRKGLSLLLAKDYVQVRFTRNYHFRQWNSLSTLHGWFLQWPRSINEVYFGRSSTTNGKTKSTNKVILKGINKKLDMAKVLWAKKLHEMLFSYQTIHHLTTKETSFTQVYGEDVMLPIKIHIPSW